MSRSQIYIPKSVVYQQRMFRRIEQGDEEAEVQLLNDYNKWRTIANRRMTNLENRGMDAYSAYNRANFALQTYDESRFPKLTQADLDDDWEKSQVMIREARRFIANPRSLIGVVKQGEISRKRYWTEQLELTPYQSDQIIPLSRAGLLDDILNVFDSDKLLEAIDFLTRGHSINEVQTRVDKYISGEGLYADLFK